MTSIPNPNWSVVGSGGGGPATAGWAMAGPGGCGAPAARFIAAGLDAAGRVAAAAVEEEFEAEVEASVSGSGSFSSCAPGCSIESICVNADFVSDPSRCVSGSPSSFSQMLPSSRRSPESVDAAAAAGDEEDAEADEADAAAAAETRIAARSAVGREASPNCWNSSFIRSST